MRDNTVSFYDKESEQYSRKRYEGKTLSYFQFLFKRRRQLFLELISRITDEVSGTDLLEIGCADGVIIKKLLQKLPKTFNSVVGLDVSPKMIEEARKTTQDSRVKYYLRGEEPRLIYGLVIELGVHAQQFENEMVFVNDNLHGNGYFIYSTAGKDSLHARIKLGGKDYVTDYMSYSKYEEIIKKYFSIVFVEPYGFFVPKLWALPRLARFVQPIFEMVFMIRDITIY